MKLTFEQLQAFAEDNLELKRRLAYEQAVGAEVVAAQALDAELVTVRRKDLTPRQTSDLINRIGLDRYMAIPYDDRPRDDLGRFRRPR